MTDFTATQAGNAKDGGTYGNTSPGAEGTDYPDFTAGGDNLDDGGFAITNVSGILGDDTVTPPLAMGGTVTLSGNLELRPGDEGIAFAGGCTLVQGANDLQIEPNDSLARLCSFAGTGAIAWTASTGAIYHSGARNSSGDCAGFLMADVSSNTWNLVIDWDGAKYSGFGTGTTDQGLELHLQTADSFLWDGGKYTDCGQIRINLQPQGAVRDGTLRIDSVAIGAWKGSFAGDVSTSPIRLQGFLAGRSVMPRITNCLIFDADPANTYSIHPSFAGDGEMNLSGTVFLNYGTQCGQKDVNLDDCWFVITTELDDVGIGVGRDGTSTQSFNGVSITGASANAHLVTIGGSSSAVTFPVDDIIFDGCGYIYPGDRGDMPIITNQTVTFNNIVQIHSGGGINPSLNADAEINIYRGTFHQAVNILCGESLGNATMIGDVKSCIFSDPYGDAIFTDGGGAMSTQTSEDINYNAFIEAEMGATNLVHGTLGDDGYFNSDMTGHLTDGVNDFHVTDFQFADDTRHGHTWAASHGYASSEQGLEDAVLASFGVTLIGGDQTVDPDTTHANYRAYIEAAYTSSNGDLSGAGDAGVDVGAYAVSLPTPPVYRRRHVGFAYG